MTARSIKARIEQISQSGRIRLFSNSWFTARCSLPTGCKPGRVYSIVLDDSTGTISEIRDLNDSTDTNYIESLYYAEIDRLQAIQSVYRNFVRSNGLQDEMDYHLAEQAGMDKISLDSYQSELEYRDNVRDAYRTTGYHVERERKNAKPKGFQTYRDDCRNERLKAGSQSSPARQR